MGKKLKKLIIAASAFLMICPVFSLTTEQDAMTKGFEAYSGSDWTSASFYLRRALSLPSNSSPEAWYMLIMSQIYSEDYTNVVADCDKFMSSYPDHPLKANVQYQKGRALHFLGRNDDAVLVLSDFCHQNPSSILYPSSIYWMGECFFDDYNFETAQTLYQKVVTDYPDSEKSSLAADKLEVISEREREQKLLYLLKMTGEEYLDSRENYERQLKQYQSEDVAELRRQLAAAKSRISELEKTTQDMSAAQAQLQAELDAAEVAAQAAAEAAKLSLEEASGEDELSEVSEAVEGSAEDTEESGEEDSSDTTTSKSQEELAALKAKAAQIQALLNKISSSSGNSSGSGNSDSNTVEDNGK